MDDKKLDDAVSAKFNKNSTEFELNNRSKIKHIIGISSGKGGVGKSMVTTLLAISLAKEGKRVGILDADITGPSIPKGFGLEFGVDGDDKLMYPRITNLGIKVMSINLILEDPTSAVVWRGPVLGSAIKQFYEDVLWEELDYLLIDMPPGTGDVALTVFQSIPLDGVIVVSTPQDLVKMIVGKAVSMCRQMNIPILGLIENMAYLNCPKCDEVIYPFGESKLDEVAKTYDILPLASLPINQDYRELVDNGNVEELDVSFMGEVLEKIELILK